MSPFFFGAIITGLTQGVAGSNLSGFASQFANRFRGTAKQLRIAERKSANRKNQTRNGATVHCEWESITIASDYNPAARCSGARLKAASGRTCRLKHAACMLMTVDQNFSQLRDVIHRKLAYLEGHESPLNTAGGTQRG